MGTGMIEKLLISFFTVFALNLAHADSIQDHANKKCKEEWTKAGVLDQRMYDYCVKKALRLQRKLIFLNSNTPTHRGLKFLILLVKINGQKLV